MRLCGFAASSNPSDIPRHGLHPTAATLARRTRDTRMTEHERRTDPESRDLSPMHTAALRARLGPASLKARVSISTQGLLAVTGLVASTLLSAAAIVAVSTRKLPPGTMPAGMKRSRW